MSKQRLPPLLLLCHRDNMKTEKILDIQHRTERKTYMVHQYKNNGYNILLDVNSGSVHVVDDLIYDMVPYYKEKGLDETVALLKDKYPEAEIREAAEDLDELIKAGKLYTEDIYENYIHDIVEAKKPVVKALCLHIAHDCNLACRYCFAEEGEYHGRRALMSYEVGKKALDFLIANSGSRHNLEVDFFGGEPLMNWQVVKDLVAYGREQEKLHNKRFRFTLTTNGVLLNDEVQEFANREMDNVVLSIDGRKEVHDRMRPFRNGKGSYDLVLPKFEKLAESRNQEKYYVRGTFTKNNKDFSNDVLHLADLGFKQISVEPVVGSDEEDYALQAEDLPEIFAEYDKLAAEMVNRQGFQFLPFHAGSDRRTLCGKETVWMWFRNRISGSDSVGRPLSVSSVRRRREISDGKCG